VKKVPIVPIVPAVQSVQAIKIRKSEYRNPKQSETGKARNSKPKRTGLEFSAF
jgi:hypothetical protein